jgi:hypothetical protein
MAGPPIRGLSSHSKAGARSVEHIESIVILVLGDKNMVGITIHHRREVGVELHSCLAIN